MTKAELIAQLKVLNPKDVDSLIEAKAEAMGYDRPAAPVTPPPAEEPDEAPAEEEGDDDNDSA